MYTRGQFCIIGKTTRKALRIYEEKDILIPASINNINGYRYYSKEQVGQILIINELKNLGLSLEEIKTILNNKENLSNLLEKRLLSVEHEIQENYKIKENIQYKLSALKKEGSQEQTFNYEVEQCEYEITESIIKRETIELSKVGRIVGELYEIISKINATAIGPHFIYYNPNDEIKEKEVNLQVGIPINSLISYENINTLTLNKGNYLKTIHTSGLSKVGLAHSSIIDFANRNNIVLTGKCIERYVSINIVEVLYEIGVN